MLTKPKILTVAFELRVVERRNAPTRYVMCAADYQRLINAGEARNNWTALHYAADVAGNALRGILFLRSRRSRVRIQDSCTGRTQDLA